MVPAARRKEIGLTGWGATSANTSGSKLAADALSHLDKDRMTALTFQYRSNDSALATGDCNRPSRTLEMPTICPASAP